MEAAVLRREGGPQLSDAPTLRSAWPGAGDAEALGGRRGPLAVGAGLRNLGNTCYANAALQCLTYTAPLARCLLSRRHAEACQRPASCVLCAMRAHVARARRCRGEVIQPATGLIAGFHRHKQEDAHEFLMFTVDAMQQACLREPERRGRRCGDSTPIRRIFGGYWRSQVKCLRCHGVSDTLDPYLDITLDIQAAQSVTQALELLVKPEKLDGDNSYHCGVCLEKVPASKTLTLHAPSEVLILVLKRFSDFTGSKLAKEVQYPEHLDMRQYLSQQDAGPLEYELYAVLVHAGGTCRSGHYFCYIKAGNGQWFKMDDAKVTACDVSSALSQDAYVLFYIQKRELQRDGGSVSAGEEQRCHWAERTGTRATPQEPETDSEVTGPEAEEPERGTSGEQVTLEQWRLLQEQSRAEPQFNLRRIERALPADAVVIHASKFSGGVTENRPEQETRLLRDAAGDVPPQGARHSGRVPCLGGRAKATKRKKKGWRPLDVLQ
ncbi:ubiquitin carboxyl-terminal hydrolase 17-like protein 6 [Pteropus alecto]|uniref:Ubiquitin carboxyl-terminal hydrolase n=1 Tax=Pteropus alecto TaxID=9402 RepID=L5KER9_PTEAL|nr:ubiquitin carboxyl-terminal hydrolase 17-like protein 6 [Pteropus alecto]ELK10055.1 Ubiquitin carboxyl-terminal hydrolase 17-like protein 2 [Pteropus alecto]